MNRNSHFKIHCLHFHCMSPFLLEPHAGYDPSAISLFLGENVFLSKWFL